MPRIDHLKRMSLSPMRVLIWGKDIVQAVQVLACEQSLWHTQTHTTHVKQYCMDLSIAGAEIVSRPLHCCTSGENYSLGAGPERCPKWWWMPQTWWWSLCSPHDATHAQYTFTQDRTTLRCVASLLDTLGTLGQFISRLPQDDSINCPKDGWWASWWLSVNIIFTLMVSPPNAQQAEVGMHVRPEYRSQVLEAALRGCGWQRRY